MTEFIKVVTIDGVPVPKEMVNRYRAARRAWQSSKFIQRAARTIGMSEREYCDRYVAQNFGPLVLMTYTGQSWVTDADRAFYGAKP